MSTTIKHHSNNYYSTFFSLALTSVLCQEIVLLLYFPMCLFVTLYIVSMQQLPNFPPNKAKVMSFYKTLFISLGIQNFT